MTVMPVVLGVALLTACTSAGGGPVESKIVKDANGVDCLVGGEASNAITVDGDFGGQLTLSSPTPVEVSELQRTVLVEGESEAYPEGENATISFTLFNGKTGEVLNQGTDATLPNDQEALAENPAFYEAVRCGAPGQRVALALPVGEALAGTSPADAGITDLTEDDAFVVVFDFALPFDEFADCEKVEPRDAKYPEVDLGDGTSEPTITIPACMEAPTEVEVKVLEEGDGPVVEDGQAVMTNYVGVMWNGGERFDGNWTDTGVKLSTTSVIEGFRQAMIGQKIGSTVLVSMPSEMAYKDGSRTFVLELVSITE